MKEKKEASDENDKWQETCEERVHKNHYDVDDEIEEDDWGIDLGEEPTLDEITDHLDWVLNGTEIDLKEPASIKMHASKEVVQLPRQLGDWTFICVDSQKRSVTCNCEKCNRDGRCQWVDTFHAIEFGLEPEMDQMSNDQPVIGFQTMVKQAVELIRYMNLRHGCYD